MARRKTQTRFVVPFEGRSKRLLSINENANGDLIITTHLEGLRNLAHGARAHKETRHTLHVSTESEGNLVHGHYLHDDGSGVHRHLLTQAVKRGRFQPLQVRSVVHPDQLADLLPPVKGPVVALHSFNPAAFTMHYAIWFSAPDASAPLMDDAPFLLEKAVFREFAVYVPYCFTPQPSSYGGWTIEYATTSAKQRSAEHAALGNRVGPSEGAPGEALDGYIVRDFNRIAAPTGQIGMTRDPSPLMWGEVPRFLRTPVG